MFVCHQNPHVKILTPKGIVSGGGAFGKELGHEDRAFMNGISALVKRPKNVPSAPLPWEGAVFEPASWLPPSTESVSTLILDFPASPAEASVVDKLPGLSWFPTAAQGDEDQQLLHPW